MGCPGASLGPIGPKSVPMRAGSVKAQDDPARHVVDFCAEEEYHRQRGRGNSDA